MTSSVRTARTGSATSAGPAYGGPRRWRPTRARSRSSSPAGPRSWAVGGRADARGVAGAVGRPAAPRVARGEHRRERRAVARADLAHRDRAGGPRRLLGPATCCGCTSSSTRCFAGTATASGPYVLGPRRRRRCGRTRSRRSRAWLAIGGRRSACSAATRPATGRTHAFRRVTPPAAEARPEPSLSPPSGRAGAAARPACGRAG